MHVVYVTDVDEAGGGFMEAMFEIIYAAKGCILFFMHHAQTLIEFITICYMAKCKIWVNERTTIIRKDAFCFEILLF